MSPIVVSALLLTGCDPGPEKPAATPVDHATAPYQSGAPEPVDPASGVLTQAWRTDLRGTFPPEGTRYEFGGAHLLVISPRGVDALDAENGATRWHYYETGRRTAGHALIADTLVLLTSRADGTGVRTVGLDAVTGGVLWRSGEFLPSDGGRQAIGWGVAVLARRADPSVLVGVDVRTGVPRWSWPGPEAPAGGRRCRYLPHDSDGALVLVQTVCGEQAKLHALDPASGRPVWERDHLAARSTAVSRGRITLVPHRSTDFTGYVLLGPGGTELHRMEARAPRGGSLVITETNAIVGYHRTPPGTDGVADHRLLSIGIPTGEVEGPAKSRAAGGLTWGRGHVYATRDRFGDYPDAHELPLLPAALEVVDPVTLRTEQVPLPASAVSGFWAGTVYPAPAGRVLLDGGRAYTAVSVRGGLRVTGYVPGDHESPRELGGVPAADWPDPCELGSGMDAVQDRHPHAPVKAGSQTISGWSCGYDWAGGAGFNVRVAWVARDAEEARRALDARSVQARPIAGLADEAYAYRSRLGVTGIALRVGRYVTVIEGEGNTDATPMAKVVARNLRSLD